MFQMGKMCLFRSPVQGALFAIQFQVIRRGTKKGRHRAGMPWRDLEAKHGARSKQSKLADQPGTLRVFRCPFFDL